MNVAAIRELDADDVREFVDDHRRALVGLAVLAGLVAPLANPGRIYVLTLVLIYAILAFGAVVPIGYSGDLILSQGAFFGIGAYTFVKLGGAGVPGWVAIPLAALFTTGVAYALGRPAIRATGIYLGIITLAFNELFVIVTELFNDFLGGSRGMPAADLWFPKAVTGAVGTEILYYYLVFAVFLAVLVPLRRLLDSETGWGFLAVQEDVVTAESYGVDTQQYRLLSFTLTGAVCGLAGGLFAPMNGYISPSMFNLEATIDIILSAVIGGIAAPVGTVVGSTVVILVPEFLRFISDVRLVVFGALLILLLVYLPEGIGGFVKRRF